MTSGGGGETAHTDTDAAGSQRSSLLGYLALLAAIVLGWLAVNAVMAVLAVL